MRLHPLRLAQAGIRVAGAHAGRLSRPLKINWCVTYWCQYRCQTCNIWQRKPTDELTTDEMLAFVGKNRRTEWLDVTGGEIFLRPDIEDVLLAVLRQWRSLIALHFPTNGFLTDRIVGAAERLAALKAAPVVITVSVDGDEALNDEIRGIKGGFVRQMETFRRLRAIRGVTAVMGMTLSRQNVNRVDDAFDACRAACPGLEPADFHLNVAQSSSHYYGTGSDADFRAAPADIVRALDGFAARRGRPRSPVQALEARYQALLRTFVETGVTPQPCHALRSSCFVDPWGIVYPCITFAHPVGRLRETGMDLAPIWAGEEARRVQRGIWAGECPQCWTACEAYQTLLGNLLAPWRAGRAPGGKTRLAGPAGERL